MQTGVVIFLIYTSDHYTLNYVAFFQSFKLIKLLCVISSPPLLISTDTYPTMPVTTHKKYYKDSNLDANALVYFGDS